MVPIITVFNPVIISIINADLLVTRASGRKCCALIANILAIVVHVVNTIFFCDASWWFPARYVAHCDSESVVERVVNVYYVASLK